MSSVRKMDHGLMRTFNDINTLSPGVGNHLPLTQFCHSESLPMEVPFEISEPKTTTE
jgi:hypothetical protein